MATPKLRFKEFASKVEVKKLGNISNIVVGFVGTVSDQYCDQNEGVPFVRTQNVREGYFSIENLEYVTKEFHKKNKKSQIFNGDVLIARVGANMGMVCAVENLNTEANCANVIIIKKNSQLNSQYLSLFLNSENGQKQIHSGGAGGAQAVFNTTLAKEISFPYFPLQEQTKIASFLSAVDEKISQLTQKHELLNQYKQGMMQKLFSQEIRFKADDGSEFGEWEDKKIGDIFKVTSGSTPLRSDERYFKNAEIFWVKTTDLNNGLITKTEEKISKVALEETSIKVLPKGTVFVAMYGGFNQIGRTGLLTMESACNQALSAIYPNQLVNPYFLLTYLNFKVEDWKSFAASSRKDPNITKSDVLAFPFILMSLEEQTKIAHFLSAIDQKIEVVAQQIEQAKQWKKGLLQQMFV